MRKPGFTLAELLIALAILGVIAVFTIPKVLQSQQDERATAHVHEAMATLGGVYEAYRLSGTPSATTHFNDMSPYLNFVRVVTNASIDHDHGTSGSQACDSWAPCYQLHNGGMFKADYGDGSPGMGNSFGGTSRTNFIYVKFDPDGKVTSSGSATGPGKAVRLMLYYDGRVTYLNHCQAGDATYLNGSLESGWCPDGEPLPDWAR